MDKSDLYFAAFMECVPGAFAPFSPSSYYVILIARPVDNKVDELVDGRIVKSFPFVPRPELTRLEVSLDAPIIASLRPGMLALYGALVPISVRIDDIRVLNDVFQRGGKVIGQAEIEVDGRRIFP